jgi:hypothetical protein
MPSLNTAEPSPQQDRINVGLVVLLCGKELWTPIKSHGSFLALLGRTAVRSAFHKRHMESPQPFSNKPIQLISCLEG